MSAPSPGCSNSGHTGSRFTGPVDRISSGSFRGPMRFRFAPKPAKLANLAVKWDGANIPASARHTSEAFEQPLNHKVHVLRFHHVGRQYVAFA